MKREAFGDDGPNNKRPRATDDDVTFLIPSKVAGSIIGKGGLNISNLRNQLSVFAKSGRGARRYSVCWLSVPPPPPPRHPPPALHEQYKASITVPDCPGPERVLTISAKDLDITMEIVKEILPKLVDGGQKGGPGTEDMDVRLLIHQSRAGCVIGKAGAKIKELREKTGARLKIFSNAAPQSTERVVQLVGKDESVAAGIREVLELVRETPIKGGIQNYDPHNYDDFYAEEYGGFGSGQAGGGGGGGGLGGGGGGGGPPRGGPPRGGPPRGGPPPRMPMGPGPGPGLGDEDMMFGGRGPPMPRGGPMGRNGPLGPPRAPFNDFPGPGPRPAFNGPPRPYGGGGTGNFGAGGGNFGANRPGAVGGGNGAPNFNSNMGGGGQQDTTTQVTIPKDLAGAIIGKAGSRIRKIRADSGAGIEIAEPLLGSNERIITITGTPQRIQTAQYLLQQSVHESHPNLGGGGRSGNF